MRYAVVGAGAIGAYVGASLSRSGAEVVLIARGAHLTAMRRAGLEVASDRGNFVVAPGCTDICADVGPVDVVIVALKAHQIAGMLDDIRHLVREDTTVISMQNGIPWWYFQGHGGVYEGRSLQSVDPNGRFAQSFHPDRVVGCAVYCATEMPEPGKIRHIAGTRFALGHVHGTTSRRLEKISADFLAAGLEAPIAADIRAHVWNTLLGNGYFHPLDAFTRSTQAESASEERVDPLERAMLDETLTVARRLGVSVDDSIARRSDGTRCPRERDCILGTVVELGEMLGVDVPAMRRERQLAVAM